MVSERERRIGELDDERYPIHTSARRISGEHGFSFNTVCVYLDAKRRGLTRSEYRNYLKENGGAFVVESPKYWEDIELVDPEKLDSNENGNGDLLAELTKREFLSRALTFLEPREREILVARYCHSFSLEKIGEEMGVCRERVRQLEERALNIFRWVAKCEGFMG